MSLIFTLVILFSVPIVIGYFYLESKKLNIVENGLKPLFQEQSGGRFNGFNLTIPFVRHTIYDNFIIIAYLKNNYVLRFNEISYVDIKRHHFSTGITYVHTIKNIPTNCIVWSKSSNKVYDILTEKNVSVKKQT